MHKNTKKKKKVLGESEIVSQRAIYFLTKKLINSILV